MKPILAVAALLVSVLVPLSARADSLLVGSVRDRDGRAVAGARVRVLDAAGVMLGAGRSDAAGTFAVDARDGAVFVLVEPADGAAIRVAVQAGEPIVTIVRRYRAVADATPSAADLAALPNPAAAAATSVLPYAVGFPNTTSERYLNGGRGAVTVDGIAFYRHVDGGGLFGALPGGAVGALTAHAPLDAPAYGDRAGGGVTALELIDGAGRATSTSSFVALRSAAGAPAGVVVRSWDADPRALVAVRTAVPLAAGARLVFDALNAGTTLDRAAGAALSFTQSGRRGDLFAHATAAGSATLPVGGMLAGNAAWLAFGARGRGIVVPDVTLRVLREAGSAPGVIGSDGEDALVAGATLDDGRTRVRALVAAQHDVDARAGGATLRAAALVPSLALDRRFDGGFVLHAGTGASTSLTPYGALDDVGFERSTLGEAVLRYAAGRVRAELMTYREHRASAPATTLTGTGWSLGWQIAPLVAARVWSLTSRDTASAAPPAYVVPTASVAANRSQPFNRAVVWFTYDPGLRIDLLDRNGVLEGSLRTPLGARVDVRVATYRRSDRVRVLTFGLDVR